jgi:hypothetical protein
MNLVTGFVGIAGDIATTKINKMIKNVKSLDHLSREVKHLLSENRCSFSDKEKVLLNDCLGYLQQAKKLGAQTSYPDIESITKALEILLQLFLVAEHLKDLF